MKKQMTYLAFALAIIAVSTAYARRGSSNVFSGSVNPLAGYASQIVAGEEPLAAAAVAPEDMGEEEFQLF